MSGFLFGLRTSSYPSFNAIADIVYVHTYQVSWNTREQNGSIRIHGLDTTSSNPTRPSSRTIEIADVHQMRLLVDRLQNESSIRYSIKHGALCTSRLEPVGEGE